MHQYDSFDDYPFYAGDDLGMTYTRESTTIKVWALTAQEARLSLYTIGTGGSAIRIIDMEKAGAGVWKSSISGDQHGVYYTIQVKESGQWLDEVAEPYARSVGANGLRAMIIDMNRTNPEGWEADVRPPLSSYSDIILYELHVRDMSIHPSSGITNQGKYLGLTESGTKNPHGQSTGIDHLVELGITHVHLLPVFDFRSIDETRLHENKYNWGYDPQNYNVPEGSFATDPADGAVRIREFKEMVLALHKAGIRVVMDVVYNHTGHTEKSNFNQLVPDYYYRQDDTGGFSNASACGNETASERGMVRKFIVESVKYWAEEYHIDGFRFDLMGIHDLLTMDEVTETLRAIDPTIFVYGEGWTAAASPLQDSLRAIKANTHKMKHVAAFSDELRDAVKGHWYEEKDKGFVSGATKRAESIKFGIVAATDHPQVDYKQVNYSSKPWAREPWQTINYVSCHDNHTLWDKLVLTNTDADEATLIRMHHLAQTIVFTSQGVPFLHNGAEFFRTKYGVENSFESPDSINQIDWGRKSIYRDGANYYKSLIQLRKNHPAFRMLTTAMIQQHLKFLPIDDEHVVGFHITGNANGDPWSEIIVIHNGGNTKKSVAVPEGIWSVVLEDHQINESGIGTVKRIMVEVKGISSLVLKR